MDKYKTILLEYKDRIAQITLNRPQKLNALNKEMYHEIKRAIAEIQQKPDIRVLVIKGSGKAFCAGGDISELSEASVSVESAQERLRMSHPVATDLRRMEQPIIMSINGDAIGGGLSIALNGDLRIASEKARFGATFIRVGLIPDMGSIFNLSRLVGISKACELAFLGDIIDAREAERVGLVNRVVPAAELSAATDEWARRLAESSPLALKLTKSALYKGLNMDFLSELEDEVNTQTLCLISQSGREGLKAFLEKRKPVFTSTQMEP